MSSLPRDGWAPLPPIRRNVRSTSRILCTSRKICYSSRENQCASAKVHSTPRDLVFPKREICHTSRDIPWTHRATILVQGESLWHSKGFVQVHISSGGRCLNIGGVCRDAHRIEKKRVVLHWVCDMTKLGSCVRSQVSCDIVAKPFLLQSDCFPYSFLLHLVLTGFHLCSVASPSIINRCLR